MRSLAIFFSILIHVSLLFFLSTGSKEGEAGSKSKHKPSSVKITIVDKPTDKENKVDKKSLIPLENKSKVLVKKKKKEKEQKKQVYVDHKCEESYVGIGVMYDGNSCLITYVGKGYPAERAGIRPGDLIVSDEIGCPGRGTLGAHITIKVMRGTRVLTLDLVREKICQKDM